MAEKSEGRGPASRPLAEASAASASMVLFALFARSPLPGFLLALCGLLLTASAAGYSFSTGAAPRELLGLPKKHGSKAVWMGAGAIIGTGLGVLLRSSRGIDLLPAAAGPFLVVAAAIGATEELLYRGYVQGRLSRLSWPVAVILAAAAHTAYKSALFAFPPEGVVIEYGSLALWTFLGGAAFGVTRHFSGSVVPALTAHVLFDIVVYGEGISGPWWVWA